jgi:hypothetical protein
MGIVNFLKKINSLPLPVTIRHYYIFDDATTKLKDNKLDSLESWDYLRENHPRFSISENRDEWLQAAESKSNKDGQDGGLRQRAQDIVQILEDKGIETLFSVGVGGAGLEYQIKKNKSEIKLICSEYSSTALNVLKKVFVESDDFVLFDITSKDWSVGFGGTGPEKQLCLIYRIDASFTNEEWKKIFENMYDAGVQNVLYIPTSCLTVMGLRNRLLRKLVWKIKSIPYAFSGYLRTKVVFQSFWRGRYIDTEVVCGGLKGFLLTRIP